MKIEIDIGDNLKNLCDFMLVKYNATPFDITNFLTQIINTDKINIKTTEDE